MQLSDVMRRLVPPGSYVLILFFLTGVWLAMSPFVMTTQPSGAHWTAATINTVTIGGVLMVVSLFGILGYMIFALRDLLREAQAQQVVSSPVEQ